MGDPSQVGSKPVLDSNNSKLCSESIENFINAPKRNLIPSDDPRLLDKNKFKSSSVELPHQESNDVCTSADFIKIINLNHLIQWCHHGIYDIGYHTFLLFYVTVILVSYEKNWKQLCCYIFVTNPFFCDNISDNDNTY